MQTILAVATDRGVYILKPGHEASDYSIHAQGLIEYRFNCIIRASNGYLYAGSEGSMVFRSRDGINWDPLYEGISFNKIYSLLSHPTDTNTLYAGSSPAALFKTTNGGQSWIKLHTFSQVPSASNWSFPYPPYLPQVRSLLFHPQRDDIIFAAVRVGGVIASLDGGESWSQRDQGIAKDINCLANHPALPNRLYAATSSGFYRSEDLGGRWTHHITGLPWTFVECFAISTEDPDQIIAGVRQGPGSGATFFRSANGGTSWEISHTGLPPLADRSITWIHNHKGAFFAATDKGDIFGTDDFGTSWYRLDANLPPIRAMCSLA